MARRESYSGRGSGLRTLLTVVIALLLLSLVVTLGLLVRPQQASAITRVLAEHGHYVEELVRVTPDLESAFLAITGGQA